MATVSTVIIGIVILFVVVWTLCKNGGKQPDVVSHDHEVSLGDMTTYATDNEKTPVNEPKVGSTHILIEEVAEPAELDLPLSEQDIFVQSAITKAQEDSVAMLQGEPHQAELSFGDEEKPEWDALVKQSFEKRVNRKSKAEAAVPSYTASEALTEQKIPEQLVMPNPLLTIHVMAPRSKQFGGEELINICHRNGLKHGEHKVLHSYAVNGKILYSLMSAVKPGILPLQTMPTFKTPGLSFVMDMDALDHPRSVFKSMLETAHQVAGELGGDVLDERHERLTALTVSDYLARIKTYTSLKQHHERSEA